MASFDNSNTGVEMEYREDLFSQRRVKSICKYETEAFIPWKITFRYVVKLHRTIFSTVYNISPPNFTILLNFFPMGNWSILIQCLPVFLPLRSVPSLSFEIEARFFDTLKQL